MSSDYFVPFFLLCAASGLFLWLIGAAATCKPLRVELVFRAPWIGYAVLIGVLQLVHLVWPINRSVSTVVVAGMGLCALGALLARGLRREWSWRRVGIGVALAVLLVAISLAVFRPVSTAAPRPCVTMIWGFIT